MMLYTNNYLDYLNNKSLFYDKIDFSVINNAYKQLSSHINLPYIIHIIGTNGKGSTGRYIASFLNQLKKRVLHYSSPHVIKFNERIWIDGTNSSDEELQFAHEQIHKLLDNDLLNRLTYFEYTTLMALVLSNNFDYIVLEAGLGGEFDATNIVKNDLTVVPSIGLDHTEFLGNTIEEIAATKLKSCDNKYIFGKNMNLEVLNIANDLLKNKEKIQLKYIKFNNNDKYLPQYLKDNLQLALNVIEYLKYNVSNLHIPNLFARFEKIQKNITIDVGHNQLAAQVIVNEYKNKKVTLIYNTYKDKDYKSVLKILKPIINNLEIIECIDERILNKDILIDTCKKLQINIKDFNINNLDEDNEYLVFGSFKVVESFLIQRKNNEN